MHTAVMSRAPGVWRRELLAPRLREGFTEKASREPGLRGRGKDCCTGPARPQEQCEERQIKALVLGVFFLKCGSNVGSDRIRKASQFGKGLSKPIQRHLHVFFREEEISEGSLG